MTLAALNTSRAYDGEVHSKINEAAVNSSQLDFVLKNQLSISGGTDYLIETNRKTKKIWQWIAYGSEAEDFGWLGKYDIPRSRAFNHFHDPLKTWDEAGLDDIFSLIYTANYFREPVSPILWGLNPGQQDFAMNLTEDCSWSKAKDSTTRNTQGTILT